MKQNVENKPGCCCMRLHWHAWKSAINCSVLAEAKVKTWN